MKNTGPDINGRSRAIAELCRRHLARKYGRKLKLVEEFIEEIEGCGEELDFSHWGRLTDSTHVNEEMLKRLDEAFEEWMVI
jgi:hypothetical protein